MPSKGQTFQMSIGAQNVEAKFYGKIAIVYVEGKDDIFFWSQYFDKERFEIRPKDGCRNLDDIVDAIINKGLKQIVARDADYSSFMKSQLFHPLVVMTTSHSIENVMYCPVNLNECLQKLSRELSDYTEEINKIYDEFCERIKELVVYDITNNIYSHGLSVMGDSCTRFLKSAHSYEIDNNKVGDYIKKLPFPNDELEEVREMMASDPRPVRQIAKGHFQTAFVLNLLKKLVSRITGNNPGTLSCDSLYALLVTCPRDCSLTCMERDLIRQRVQRAVKFL